MEITFYKSEGGNITVVNVGNGNLLIRTDIPGTFLVNNPLSTVAANIHTITVSSKMTPEEIFDKIDQFYQELKPSTMFL